MFSFSCNFQDDAEDRSQMEQLREAEEDDPRYEIMRNVSMKVRIRTCKQYLISISYTFVK